MTILGIDPGVSGGLALLDRDGSYLGAWKMPDSASKIREIVLLADCVACEDPPYHAFSKSSMQSMCKLHRQYGEIRAVIDLAGYTALYVRPQEWQSILPDVPNDSNKARGYSYASPRKAHHVRCATRYWEKAFPLDRKPHDGIADALWIAEYYRRQKELKPSP